MSTLAWTEVRAEKVNCNFFFHKLTREITAYELNHGISLIDFKPKKIYLTNFFINKLLLHSKQNIKKNVQEILNVNNERKVFTYAYSADQNSGSGRDYILSTNEAVKGAGTNEVYSDFIQAYNLRDFRKNGLQKFDESLVEFATAKNFKQRDIPVIEYKDFIILSDEIQDLILGEIDTPRSKLSAHAYTLSQTIRDPFEGRQSQDPSRITEVQKAKLAALLTINNVNHGSINQHNLSSLGKIVDLGHSGFGYPFFSAAYRCTLCKQLEGSSWDSSLKSVFDYFYPSQKHNGSYEHAINQSSAELILNEMRIALGLPPLTLGYLGEQNEFKSLNLILNERLTIGADYLKVQYLGSMLLGQNEFDPNSLYKPSRLSFSFRFLLQLLFLKPLLGDAAFQEALSETRKAFELRENTYKDLCTVLAFLETHFLESSITDLEFLKNRLYSDFLPANVLMSNVASGLKDIKNTKITEINEKSKALLEEFQKPIYFGPERLLEVLQTQLELSNGKWRQIPKWKFWKKNR